MNNMDLYIPEFLPGPAAPGSIVSVLRDSAGSPRAAFVYRGLASYQGREVMQLDLVQSDGNSVGRTIGFSLVDRQRALPVLFAAAGNPSIRVEQTSCRD